MAHRTDPTELDEALARILAEPTWARQILTATAAALQTADPFLTVTYWELNQALDTAHAAVTAGLPAYVAREAKEQASMALPMTHERETCDAYALRLLDVAKAL